jgi:hypothetical protein
MTDYMDQLVDAQTQMDLEDAERRRAEKKKDDRSRELLAEGAMTEEAARRVTDSIKAAATATWILIKRAHDGKAWKSLGYSTWSEYVSTEFDMSTSRSYQLINQASVISELESAAPDGTRLMLTEAQTRDIKDTLPKITERVKAETSNDDPIVAADKINKIVQDERASIKNDASSDPNDNDVKNDSFQDLDPKGNAPRADRLSASDSGSTADDIDLDDDIPGEDPVSQLDDYDSDAMNEDEQTLSYLFSYFDTLSDPSVVAKNFSGDLESTKSKVDSVIKWFSDFKHHLS